MTKETLEQFWEYLGREVLPYADKPAEVLIEIVKDKDDEHEHRERIEIRNTKAPDGSGRRPSVRPVCIPRSLPKRRA